ncbi:helix-turn-helix transcriptional regulator [Nocardia sp. PE-7]|uniref:helix-turn-helix transcriptional regulator n=1 Tax=Nocardia sp. PE-7 TaxID=3058426 RepID=UPI002658CA22|nr:helix-turn-helix transcriptional regulator [Nocardia sp. PE-7]WKG08479.1 helix-turn-helix transcriptional regulator [Nocardia sp. PE-7]
MDRAELATVLRTARSRLTPADAGLPNGSRRQVPGLRREEVANLAGVSVDYIVRLEQGRGPKPSEQVLGALTRALRLTDVDRDLVYRLAGSEPPQAGRIPMAIRPSVLRLLDRLADLPVLVLSAKSDVLAWNPLSAALLGDFSAIPVAERNIMWQRFLGSGVGRLVMTPEEAESNAAACVGCLRSVKATYPDDPDLSRLLNELRTGSTEFEALWQEGRSSAMHSLTKTIAHPELGALTLDCDAMHVPDTDQTVIIYSAAPHTHTATALDLLRVTGLESFATPTTE